MHAKTELHLCTEYHAKTELHLCTKYLICAEQQAVLRAGPENGSRAAGAVAQERRERQ